MTDNNTPSRDQVWKMFDRIAHRYDLLNRLLSFGQDIYWRNRLAKETEPKQKILDLATGTADILLTICKKHPDFKFAVGLDMSTKMLEHGRVKVDKSFPDRDIQLITGNAETIPFEAGCFDRVTIAFGIRNVSDVGLGLREMLRILNEDGKALILEFSLPKNFIIRAKYLFYFRYILPILGSIISGDNYAYKYLNKTVETFPYGEDFLNLMREAGFNNVSAVPLTFGIATLYIGEK